MLTPRTAAQLASQGRKAREAVSRRDALIRAAVAEGGTLREVGAAVGLSHQAVSNIVAR